MAAADELLIRLRRDFPQSGHRAEATLRLAEHAVAAARLFAGRTAGWRKSRSQTRPPRSRPQALVSPGAHRHRTGAMERRRRAARSTVGTISREPVGCVPPTYLRAEASYRRGDFEQAAQRLTDLAARPRIAPEPWSATGRTAPRPGAGSIETLGRSPGRRPRRSRRDFPISINNTKSTI